MLTTKQPETQDQAQAVVETVFEYHIVMQSDELDHDTGVPDDTQEWVAPFFSPQNETSLIKEYEGWINQAGYHLVTFDLREIKAKFSGELSYRSVWLAPGYAPYDEEF